MPDAREKTLQLIVGGLKTSPAYLLLFGLGVVAGGIVLGAFAWGDTKIGLISAGGWAGFLVGAVILIAITEWGRNKASGYHTPFGPSDSSAISAFFAGPDAQHLAGTWKAFWQDKEGKPYNPDPQERMVITTEGPEVCCHSFDPSTKKTYFLFGVFRSTGVLPLIYWSTAEPGYSALTGVVLLKLDDSFEGKGQRFTGEWSGWGREGKIISGKTVWEREG
jgi:hypothetical protein